MFDFVRKHTRLMQFILVLLIFPSFVFFGIQGYSRFTDGTNRSVAKVGGQSITQAEWDSAHRAQAERIQRQMPGVDPKLFDRPEFRRETLEQLVRERVMLTAAAKLNLATTDERLQRIFATDPQFAFLRNPDGSVNRDVLAAQGMSSEQLAARLRHDLTVRQVMLGVAGSALAPQTSADAAFDALLQQREVQVQRFAAADYLSKVNPTDAEIKAYYDDPAHKSQFMTPESASIEYLVLDLEAIKKTLSVADDELRKYYDENIARFSTPQERRASHILVKADKSAPADEKARAKAKAQSLLDQVRKNPASFAELAKKNSDDPGSAGRGGDLDYFGRGAMVKPFEDAAFALKPGEISDVVETDFGYHVIKLDAVRGGEKKPFEAVRAQVEGEVKAQLAQRRYAEAAEQFSNLVYEQSDSLKPAADKLKLDVRTATVARTPAPGASGALASAKLLDAIFGNETLRNKRNTEAVEVGPSQMASARVVQHMPAAMKPLDSVKAQIRDTLARRQAAALARRDGEARVAALKSGADAAGLSAPQVVSRARPGPVPGAVVDAALKADATQLPVVAGVTLGDEGYAVVRVTKVLGRDPSAVDAPRARQQYAQAWSAAESQAYYEALKTRYKASIAPDAMTPPAAAN